MIEEHKDIYLSALFDLKGSFNLSSNLKKSGYSNYRTEMCLSISNVLLHSWLIDNYGGRVNSILNADKNSQSNVVSYWYINAKDQMNICEKILPYLIVRKDECKCFLDFRKTYLKGKSKGSGFKLSDDTISEREFLIETLSEKILKRQTNKKFDMEGTYD